MKADDEIDASGLLCPLPVLRLRKKIDALEEELNGLRALPLSKNEDPAWNSDEGTLQLADDSPRND